MLCVGVVARLYVMVCRRRWLFGIGGVVRACWFHLLLRVACLCCCFVTLWFVCVVRCAMVPVVVGCELVWLCVDWCLLCGVLMLPLTVEVCCLLLNVVVIEC